MIGIRWGVWNAQRAINSIAVLQRRVTVFIISIVAGLTKVCCAEAAEEGYTTTKLALPINLLAAMLLAFSRTGTDLAQEAVLAEKILLFRVLLLSISHLLLTVNQTSKVRLLALEALVERASVVRKLLWAAEIRI